MNVGVVLWSFWLCFWCYWFWWGCWCKIMMVEVKCFGFCCWLVLFLYWWVFVIGSNILSLGCWLFGVYLWIWIMCLWDGWLVYGCVCVFVKIWFVLWWRSGFRGRRNWYYVDRVEWWMEVVFGFVCFGDIVWLSVFWCFDVFCGWRVNLFDGLLWICGVIYLWVWWFMWI